MGNGQILIFVLFVDHYINSHRYDKYFVWGLIDATFITNTDNKLIKSAQDNPGRTNIYLMDIKYRKI